MKSFVLLSIVFMVFLFLTIQVSAHDLIDDTCKKTHFYDLFVTTLRSDPQSSKVDVQGLARITFKDVRLFNVLYTCLIQYNAMVYYDLSVAIHGLAKGYTTIAEVSAGLIATDAHTCGKGLKRFPELDSETIVKILL
ncbi:hypothetical protein EZV62_000138 [Acer yangbiense]|uniref:Pectinesterase inhibitor domain-containing protein n=1 Tax=Acer yangbiense TaxID=1000413 RepID=A0A5C7IR65_9ROSI|nr:hypothetical protein EZV62_000138 [Acer yangbiense]